jgi:hypothetical protein
MSEYQLNKSGANVLGGVPGLHFQPFNGLCNGVDTQPGYLQTAMYVSIFISKLLIHSVTTFQPSTFLVRSLRA